MRRSPTLDRKPINFRRSDLERRSEKKYDPKNVTAFEPEHLADLGRHTNALRECLQRHYKHVRRQTERRVTLARFRRERP